MEASPSDSVMKMEDKHQDRTDQWDLDQPLPARKSSGVLNVVISGIALFSDGYNAQISTSRSLIVKLEGPDCLIILVLTPMIVFSWIYGTTLLRAVSSKIHRQAIILELVIELTSILHRYKDGMSSTMKARLSNSYLIGEIFGMLFFGVLIDRIGRRTGIITTTAFLILGIVLATAAHGNSQLG
jgi:hypothetical protein